MDIPIDRTDPRGPTAAGVYHAEIKSAEGRESKKTGDRYIQVEFVDVPSHEYLCHDILMMQGKGRGIGVKKLDMLGWPRTATSVDPHRLIGRRCYIDTVVNTYQGQQQLKVTIEGGDHMGYWAEDSPPREDIEVLSLKPDDEGDVPF